MKVDTSTDVKPGTEVNLHTFGPALIVSDANGNKLLELMSWTMEPSLVNKETHLHVTGWVPYESGHRGVSLFLE